MNTTDPSTMTVAELKAYTEAKEKREKLEAEDREIELANTTLKGHVLYDFHNNCDWICFNATLFTKFWKDKWGSLKYTSQSVGVVKYTKPKDKIEVGRSTSLFDESFESVANLRSRFTGEMDIKRFKELRAYPKHFTDLFFSQCINGLTGMTTVGQLREEFIHESEINLPVDILFAQLDANDANLLPKVYQLPGYKYIITPQSLAQARIKIREDEEQLSRGSHLYQACDMGYVRGKYEQHSRLRRILSEYERTMKNTPPN